MDLSQTIELAALIPAAFLWMWIAKAVFDFVDRSADSAVQEESNVAVGLARAGLYVGIALGLIGAVRGPSAGFRADLLALLVDGATLTALVLIAAWVNDRVVLPGIHNRSALQAGNLAVGVVELAMFVATGLIAMGAYSGVGGGTISAVAFFLLGQLALVVLVRIYEAVTPFDAIGQIREGNTSAGVMVGGMMVALGIVLSASAGGDFTGWGADLTAFILSAAVGVAVLLVLLWPIDWIFLPSTTFRIEIERDRNVAATAVAASVQIAVALVITAALL